MCDPDVKWITRTGFVFEGLRYGYNRIHRAGQLHDNLEGKDMSKERRAISESNAWQKKTREAGAV